MPANTYDFLGGGGDIAAPNAQAQQDPNDLPNPANPGGISNNQMARNSAAGTSKQFASQLGSQPQTVRGTPDASGFTPTFSTAPAGTQLSQRTDSHGRVIQVVSDGSSVPQQQAAFDALGTVTPLGYANGAQQLGINTPPPGAGNLATDPLTANGTGAGSSQLAQRDAQGFIDTSKLIGAGGPAQRTDAANDDVRQFLDEERNRKGPSEAEALLSKASDRIRAQSLGIAAGARGGAGAREQAQREATAANYAQGAQTTQDIGQLRAQEDVTKQNRLLQTLQLLGQLGISGDQTAAQYAGYGANLQGQGVQAASNAEGNAAAGGRQQALIGNSNYQFNNLSAAQQADIAEKRRLEPSFGEEVLQYGSKYLPLLGKL